MQPDLKIINELVRRIVECAHPLRIILFGSSARDEMTKDSDLDVLVVMPDGVHRRRTAMDLHRRMYGLGAAVDIVVATPSILEKHRDTFGLIYREALRGGREIYAA